MNEIVVKDNIKIEDLIYEVRGKQVMLDSDLAKLYGCKNGTKDINKAVKRNIDRFPNDFYFQIIKDEYDILKFQNGTSSEKEHGGIRKLPYVFTEQGVAMLATVLRTENASIVSVNIMRAFVIMRKIISCDLYRNNNILINHENRILLLEESFDKLSTKENNNHIFYEGQIYDAYSLLIDILSKAKEEIIIIDNYAGKELFDITRNIKTNIKIYTKNIDDISKKKYEKEYSNIEVVTTDMFHDRFIILDNKKLYHSGSSFKDLGKRCFAITKIEDISLLKELTNRLKEV